MTKRVTISEAIRATVLPLKVETMLASFKASVEAYEVATFDGWQGKFPPNTTSPAQLWDAIGELSCFETDWALLKAQLVRQGESEVTCSCGAHFVSAFLIRQRWSLMILGRQSLITPVSELLPIRTKTMEALARIQHRGVVAVLDTGVRFEHPDLRRVSDQVGDGKLSFASPERLMKYLGVTPGSVSPFGLIHDTGQHVRVYLDRELKESGRISFHPNINTATLVLSFDDFARFLAASGHQVRYIDVARA